MKKLDSASVPHLTKARNTHSGDPVLDSVDSNSKRRWMEKLDSGSVPVMCLLCKCGLGSGPSSCVLKIGPSRCVDWEECFPDVGTGKGACSMCGLGKGPSVGTRKRAFAVCRLGMMAALIEKLGRMNVYLFIYLLEKFV